MPAPPRPTPRTSLASAPEAKTPGSGPPAPRPASAPSIPRPASRGDAARAPSPPVFVEDRSSETRRLGSNPQALQSLAFDETIPAPLFEAEPPRCEPEPPQFLDSIDIVPAAPTGAHPIAHPSASAATPPRAAEPSRAAVEPPLAEAPAPRPRSDAPAGRLLLVDAPAPAPTLYVPGDVIDGKYRLTRIIGRGGMGAVWLAHNIPLDMDVAVKLIRRDRTAPEAPGRLLQEARAAARLKHPSIVRVFDFGESEHGDPFIVMELLNGESLAAILRRKKRLSPANAVQTLLPVASALASAHGKGIVHRDLKPDNILLITDESGALVPKVVDFGIAKLLSTSASDPTFTLAGEVLGSPDYMSPEQARGADNVGAASDIWTFSVVLYEAVAGRRPFEGSNYNSLIAAILTNDPPPIEGLGDAALWAILQRGLAKNMASRWATMRDLGAALAQWAVDHGIEDDACGNRIAKQWLSGAMRRIFTVYPEQQVEISTGVRPAAGAAGALDAGSKSGSAAGSPVDTQTSRRARRPGATFWIGLFTPVVIGCGVLGYLTREALLGRSRGAESTAALLSSAVPAPPSSAPVAAAPPSVAAAPASAVATATAAAPASAAADAAPPASAKSPKGAKPPAGVRKKAPSVPKSITF